MRPMLRPGTHVLRRGRGELQVGLDPETALVLPDAPCVRESLRRLTTPGAAPARRAATPLDRPGEPGEPDQPGEASDTGAAGDPDVHQDVLAALSAHGLLLDEHDLLPLLADEHVPATLTAALARSRGAGAAAARTTRRRSRTAVQSFGHTSAAGLADDLVGLLGQAGLGTTRLGGPAVTGAGAGAGSRARRGSGPVAHPGAGAAPDVAVLVGVGEPRRELLEGWTRSRTAYLLVRLTEGRAVVGPFVAPGQTACLNCLDAHCTDADPSWPLLVAQYAAAAEHDRPDGAPEPVDPLLSALALAWAARDLASFVDGLRPSTWSATVTVHPTLARIETRSWLRHPACACTWE